MVARNLLRIAGKRYSECARVASSKQLNPKASTRSESELLIAFGTASDWARRAAEVKPLVYERRKMNRSARSLGVSEMVRFNFSWTSLNALFSRDSTLGLLGQPGGGGELTKFKLLYAASNFQKADEVALTSKLLTVLSTPINTVLPEVTGTPTTLQVLYYKYTPSHNQVVGVGKTIRDCLASGNFSALDLPTLIYAMRNWSVHGGVIDNSFRNEKRFYDYMETIQLSLAKIHDGCSQALLTSL